MTTPNTNPTITPGTGPATGNNPRNGLNVPNQPASAANDLTTANMPPVNGAGVTPENTHLLENKGQLEQWKQWQPVLDGKNIELLSPAIDTQKSFKDSLDKTALEKNPRTWKRGYMRVLQGSPRRFREEMVEVIARQMKEEHSEKMADAEAKGEKGPEPRSDRDFSRFAEMEYDRRDGLSRDQTGKSLHGFFKDVVHMRPELFLTDSDIREITANMSSSHPEFDRLTQPCGAGNHPGKPAEHPEWLAAAHDAYLSGKNIEAKEPVRITVDPMTADGKPLPEEVVEEERIKREVTHFENVDTSTELAALLGADPVDGKVAVEDLAKAYADILREGGNVLDKIGSHPLVDLSDGPIGSNEARVAVFAGINGASTDEMMALKLAYQKATDGGDFEKDFIDAAKNSNWREELIESAQQRMGGFDPLVHAHEIYNGAVDHGWNYHKGVERTECAVVGLSEAQMRLVGEVHAQEFHEYMLRHSTHHLSDKLMKGIPAKYMAPADIEGTAQSFESATKKNWKDWNRNQIEAMNAITSGHMTANHLVALEQYYDETRGAGKFMEMLKNLGGEDEELALRARSLARRAVQEGRGHERLHKLLPELKKKHEAIRAAR